MSDFDVFRVVGGSCVQGVSLCGRVLLFLLLLLVAHSNSRFSCLALNLNVT